MLSVDLLFCHEVFEAVSHYLGIAIASDFGPTLSVFTVFSLADFSVNIYNVS